MPEDVNRILELAGPSARQPAGQAAFSKSARIIRTCAFLALGSMIIFWLMMALLPTVGVARGTVNELSALLLVMEFYFLICLSIAVAITAIMGFVGAKRHPGNWKVVVWALVLTFLAVAGFIVWFLIALSRSKLFF